MATRRDYYLLAKPGIVYGNALHVLAGICLAYQFNWSWTAVIGVLVGTSAVIASACIVNNYFDRSIDARMERTVRRGLASGAVSLRIALILAVIYFVLGMAVLTLTTNILTVVIGLVAYVLYAFIYTYSKRITVHSTLIGTVPGALPGVAGYTALSGVFDTTAWLIFLVLVVWQLPHFYAIAMRRKKDYKNAGVPMLTDTMTTSSLQRLIIILLIINVAVVAVFSLAVLYWPPAILFTGGAIWWLYGALTVRRDADAWSKKVFFQSLVMSLLFFVVSLINLLSAKLI